jgi:hypothetical protein
MEAGHFQIWNLLNKVLMHLTRISHQAAQNADEALADLRKLG